MELWPQQVVMSGPTVLTQFIITRTLLDHSSGSNHTFTGLSLAITLKRRIINEILTTYLPTVLLLIIVYATNYFKEFFFEAVVSVNLTALLVLTTLFISVSASLPKTAYVKAEQISSLANCQIWRNNLQALGYLTESSDGRYLVNCRPDNSFL